AILSLHETGIEQRVLARPWPAPMARYAEAGVDARSFGFSAADRLLGRGRAIRHAAREMGADLVHAWMQRAASFLPRRLPCPVIGWFGDRYDLKYFRRADSCITVTPDLTAYVRGSGFPAERVFTVNTFGTMPEAPPVSRASLGTPEDATVLLVLSRLHRVKGIDTMLHALSRLPGPTLWLAGDGPERGSYARLAQTLGLSDRVRFLGWRDDRRALLEACDICVLPSRYEPFGTVIAEAWAMGRPLVATRADGARQYVTDGVDGLLCPVEDDAALAAAIQRIIAEPSLGAALAAGGRAAYERDFTREIVTRRLIACYEACIRLGHRA
ncbi:MAG TPA: glycosyltransferase, partial [Acetobacteraceae bacterium]